MNDLKTLHDAWGTPEAPSLTARAEARAALLDRATLGAGRGRAPARRAFRPPRTRRLVVVGALAVAIATGVTVVGNSGDQGRATPSNVYNLFNAILRNGGVLPPRLEAAIFRALKQVPGVTLVENAPAVPGRPVLALGRVQDGWLHEQVLLDRRTYAYRGERSVVLTDHNPKDPSLKKDTVITAIRLAPAIVDHPGQRP